MRTKKTDTVNQLTRLVAGKCEVDVRKVIPDALLRGSKRKVLGRGQGDWIFITQLCEEVEVMLDITIGDRERDRIETFRDLCTAAEKEQGGDEL